MTQIHQTEPQSSHFNKNGYSLPCTVMLQLPEESPLYYYYLSDDMKHDWAYSSSVIRHLNQLWNPKILRFKSDNCATQYNSLWMFGFYRSFSEEIGQQ